MDNEHPKIGQIIDLIVEKNYSAQIDSSRFDRKYDYKNNFIFILIV